MELRLISPTLGFKIHIFHRPEELLDVNLDSTTFLHGYHTFEISRVVYPVQLLGPCDYRAPGEMYNTR